MVHIVKAASLERSLLRSEGRTHEADIFDTAGFRLVSAGLSPSLRPDAKHLDDESAT
jgi:hypothetical protein